MSFDASVWHTRDLLPEGSILRGKWQGRSYRIVRLLGRGANGAVYLAECAGGRIALKVSDSAAALSLEYDRLRKFAQDDAGRSIGPRALELDDAEIGERTVFFLAMEYLEGLPIDAFIQARGRDWTPLCLLRVMRLLESLHRHGYIFCDLKPANIIFSLDTAEPRLVDFGGVTPSGQAVKEFTETFDRAWWGKGSRRADPEYDLFAAAMLGLQLVAPFARPDREKLARMRPVERGDWLRVHVRQADAASFPELPTIAAVLFGRIGAMDEFRQKLTYGLGKVARQAEGGPQAASRKPTRRFRRRRKVWDRTDWFLFASVMSLVAALTTVILFAGQAP